MCKCIHHSIHIISEGACCVRYATICKYFHSNSVMQMVIWCHNLGDLHVWYVRASLTPMILHATLVLVGNTVYIHS